MKRFWLFVLLMAGSLAVLTSPAMAKPEEGSDDSSGTSLEDINSALGGMSAHMNEIDKKLHLTIFGDVRGRYALWTQTQSDKNAPPPTTITDKGIGRYRARIGAKITRGDIAGGLRIATGGSANPNSENNTYANAFQQPAVDIDQAYLTYTPGFLNNVLKVTAGKMGNPLFFSPMTWDPDINPEGAALEISKSGLVFRADYFELVSNAGAAQPVTNLPSGTVTNTGAGADEYMANFQLEENLKLDPVDVKLLVGYEYIPNATALAGGNLAGIIIGPKSPLTTSNKPVGVGNIWDVGKIIPDFQVLEGAIQVKHKIGDVPMVWTAHLIDNINSFKVPNGESLTNGPPAGSTYTTLSNELGGYLEVKAGDTNKGNFLGCLAASYVEPNAQMANLASDDANFTNTEYLFEQVGYGLEENVSLLLSVWELQRIYYNYYGALNNSAITSGGTSRDPEFQIYMDCLLTL